MSVRMALAKLCAATCGGALIGGGAVHVAEGQRTNATYVKKIKQKRVVHRTAAKPTRIRKVVTRTVASCPPAVVTVATQAAPIPLPPPYEMGSTGAVGPAVIGGTGGFGGGGGGGFFGGGFFGGSGGSGSSGIVISSTSSTSGSSSTSTSSSTGGAKVDIDNKNENTNSNDNKNTNNNDVKNENNNTNQQQQGQQQGQAQGQAQGQINYGSSSKGWNSNGGWDKHDHPHKPGTHPDNPSPVPAPPMIILFGAAAAGLVARKRFAKRTAIAA